MKKAGLERPLGVLIDPLAERELARGRPFEHTYAHLGPFGHKLGLRVAFFSPNGVDTRSKTAWAWEYAPGGFRREKVLLPRAVYNRLAQRAVERRPAVRRLLGEIKKERLLFNPRFLAKDEALRALQKRGVPAPRFAPCRDATEVLAALRSFGVAYLKPVDGSLGRGIVRLERTSKSGEERFIAVANQEAPAPPARTAGDLSFLMGFLNHHVHSGTHLIQEGVDLPLIDGGPVDLRVLVQRAGGEWRLTGVAGRAAPRGRISTHTVRGGRAVSFSRVAALCGIDRSAVEEVAISAAQAVEAELGEVFFEFSADLAATWDGRLYVLEMNAKPFPFDEEEIRALAARRLLDFALGSRGNGQSFTA